MAAMDDDEPSESFIHQGDVTRKVVNAESTVSCPSTTLGDQDTRKPSLRTNKWKVCVTWLVFFTYGLSDGTVGALLPSIQAAYGVSYTVVSVVFLCQVLGYGVMSLGTQTLLNVVGRRWGSVIGCGLLCGAHLCITFGPPFPVVVCAFIALGFAVGIFEAMLNAFAGSLQEAGMVLGCLHGFYGLGAAVAPIIATQMVVHGIVWHHFYALLTGVDFLILILCTIVFRKDTASAIKTEEEQAGARHHRGDSQDNASPTVVTMGKAPAAEKQLIEIMAKVEEDVRPVKKESVIRIVLHSRFCLIGAIYTFLYLGLEIGAGGWLSQYLQKVRGVEESVAGFVNSGFWFGLTAGRFVLSWPASHLLGEWVACQLFMTIALAFELVFWLTPGIVGPSVAISLVGFWIGPTFPLLIELATRYLEPRLYVTAIGFIASLGSVGGAILPFVIGILATSKSPRVVPYMLTALLIGCLLTWCFLPGRGPLRFGRISAAVPVA